MKYLLTVYWSVCGTIEVEANSSEEAIIQTIVKL